jgi:hypothetical protein
MKRERLVEGFLRFSVPLSLAAFLIWNEGCASAGSGPRLTQARGIPSYWAPEEEDNAAKLLRPPDGKSVIYLLHQGGTMQRRLTVGIDLLVDGRPVRELQPGTYCVATLEPGQHAIAVRSALQFRPGIMETGKSGYAGKRVIYDLQPNQTYFFSATINYRQYQQRNDQQMVLVTVTDAVWMELNKLDETTGRKFLEKSHLTDQIPQGGQ